MPLISCSPCSGTKEPALPSAEWTGHFSEEEVAPGFLSGATSPVNNVPEVPEVPVSAPTEIPVNNVPEVPVSLPAATPDIGAVQSPKKEKTDNAKYIFLVRHAESVWNQMLGGNYRLAPKLLRARDHQLSEEGLHQAQELRQKLEKHRAKAETTPNFTTDYHSRFFRKKGMNIFCSPLLRAMQTAHYVLHADDGWSHIELVSKAREWLHHEVPGVRWPTERDCISEKGNWGNKITERALRLDPGLTELRQRVDPGDCWVKWWPTKAESQANMTERIKDLWKTLCGKPACILVSHSNVIKVLANLLSGSSLGHISHRGSELLQEASAKKLQNAGVIGLRCVQIPSQDWVVQDAVLMFDTGFEDGRKSKDAAPSAPNG